MTRMRSLLAAAVAVAVSVPASGQTPPLSPANCSAADALARDAYRHIEARAAYEKIGDEPCAVKGRKDLDASWGAAKALYDAGRQIEKQNASVARDRYLAALQKEPAFADAANALALLGKTEQTDVYAGAMNLAEYGFRAEAVATLKKVLATGRKLPDRLQHLVRPTVKQRAENWLEDNASALAKLLGLVALALLIRALIRPSIEISDFKDESVSLKIGRDLAALTRERLKRFQTTYEPKLGLMNGPQQTVSLPDNLSKALPPTFSWVSLIPSLIAMIRPRAALTVEGFVHPPCAGRGAGLTLTMTRGKELKHTSTLWQSEFNKKVLRANDKDPSGVSDLKDPSGFYDLAEPAAVWMLFRIHEEMGR